MKCLTLFICLFPVWVSPVVSVGIDQFIEQELYKQVLGKRVGLVVNHTSLNATQTPTMECLQNKGVDIVALFTPEHGLSGSVSAGGAVSHNHVNTVSIYSLYGSSRRPSAEMLSKVDVLIYDIQDIGVRSYTYATTLFYIMEEAAKYHIPIWVCDRPNPINGLTVDGSMLNEKLRSFVGYINVPYCHGMTIGELAAFFNKEYNIGADLSVSPMQGWYREMSFDDTGLVWVPTSPHIPESVTPVFYATTGILGELGIVNIGVGYTLPFQVVGAPWIDADGFANVLNQQKLPGVKFVPFHYRPFYGKFKGERCHGVLIRITDSSKYLPCRVLYTLLDMLKIRYPEQMNLVVKGLSAEKKMGLIKAHGDRVIYESLTHSKSMMWTLIGYHQKERRSFLKLRKKYLMYQ